MKTERNTGSPSNLKSKPRATNWFHRRRTAILFLSLVSMVEIVKLPGLLLWARIRILTSLPKTAIADDPSQPVASIEPPVELDTGLLQSAPVIEGVRTDPFQIDRDIFPDTIAVLSTMQTNPFDTAVVASPIALPSAEELHQIAMDAAQRDADGFRLQSAGRGFSLAVIDGRTHRIGEWMHGSNGIAFMLAEILDGSAVLQSEIVAVDGTTQVERFEIRLRGYSPRREPAPK